MRRLRRLAKRVSLALYQHLWWGESLRQSWHTSAYINRKETSDG